MVHQRLDLQRTGSVYLDRPVPTPNRRPTGTRRSGRRMLASALLALGLLSLSLAALVAGLRALVFDTDLWMDAVEATLDDPAVRPEIEEEVAAGIEQGLVGPEATDAVAAFGFDVGAEATAVAGAVIDDAAVRAELRVLVEAAHGQVLVERTGADVDLGPMSAAVLDVIRREAPELASIVPADATLWAVDSETFPDATWADGLADLALATLLLGGLMIPAGVAVHPRRHLATAMVGRSFLIAGLVAAVAAVGLPYLAGAVTGWRAFEIAVRSISIKLLAPAVITGILGMGLISFGAVLKHRARRRITDQGAAAALGYDEPVPWQQPTSPTLDLASRGLVDVNHPLTNI